MYNFTMYILIFHLISRFLKSYKRNPTCLDQIKVSYHSKSVLTILGSILQYGQFPFWWKTVRHIVFCPNVTGIIVKKYAQYNFWPTKTHAKCAESRFGFARYIKKKKKTATSVPVRKTLLSHFTHVHSNGSPI